MYTPDRIDRLEPNQIFVFGSNLQGHHIGGAARAAFNKFGAIWGQGVGLQGQCYAIPTMQGGVETIKPYVDEFIQFAKQHSEYSFLVTRIGCGIAGFNDREIAPLFSDAIDCENIVLPKKFVEILILPEKTRETLMRQTQGQVRTMADIIIALNKERLFTSPEEALNEIKKYIDRILQGGDEVAFTSVRMLYNSLKEAFAEGSLDVDCLRKSMDGFDNRYTEWDKAYLTYCIDKLVKIIDYFNDFRRYKNANSVIEDLIVTGVFAFNHCGPQREPYFFNFSRYPIYFFQRGVRENWDIITTNGILDNQKLNNIMFDRHQRGLRKYGLNAVIKHDYVQDSPCHPEVYFPKQVGTGPVFVEKKRRFIKSCGEGTGPNSIPDWFEIAYARPLLESSHDYISVDNFYVPVNDYTLPVYHRIFGKIEPPEGMSSPEYIKRIKEGHGRL